MSNTAELSELRRPSVLSAVNKDAHKYQLPAALARKLQADDKQRAVEVNKEMQRKATQAKEAEERAELSRKHQRMTFLPFLRKHEHWGSSTPRFRDHTRAGPGYCDAPTQIYCYARY